MVVRGGQNIYNNMMGCGHINCFKNRSETQSILNDFEKNFGTRMHTNFSKVFEKHVKIDKRP